MSKDILFGAVETSLTIKARTQIPHFVKKVYLCTVTMDIWSYRILSNQ